MGSSSSGSLNLTWTSAPSSVWARTPAVPARAFHSDVSVGLRAVDLARALGTSAQPTEEEKHKDVCLFIGHQCVSK